MNAVEKQTYSTREAALILGVSHQTVARMVRDEKLPAIDTGARRVVIPMWAVDRLVAPPEVVEITVSGKRIVAAAMDGAA